MNSLGRFVAGALLLIIPLFLAISSTGLAVGEEHPDVGCSEAVTTGNVYAECHANQDGFETRLMCYDAIRGCPPMTLVYCEQNVFHGALHECQFATCKEIANYLDISWHGHDLVEEFVCEKIR